MSVGPGARGTLGAPPPPERGRVGVGVIRQSVGVEKERPVDWRICLFAPRPSFHVRRIAAQSPARAELILLRSKRAPRSTSTLSRVTPTIADASHRRSWRQERRPKAAYALPLSGGGGAPSLW